MPKKRPLAERFWEKVDRGNPHDCWPWIAAKDGYGYGMIGVGAHGTRRAHVVSFEIPNGAVPHGFMVRHSCDNPQCVNPAHLLIGRPIDNSADMVARSRQRSGKAKLTLAQVDEICASALSTREIAAKYGISKTRAWSLRAGIKLPKVGLI